jgi:hypothetical protein
MLKVEVSKKLLSITSTILDYLCSSYLLKLHGRKASTSLCLQVN